jgi:hypothetical protein
VADRGQTHEEVLVSFSEGIHVSVMLICQRCGAEEYEDGGQDIDAEDVMDMAGWHWCNDPVDPADDGVLMCPSCLAEATKEDEELSPDELAELMALVAQRA